MRFVPTVPPLLIAAALLASACSSTSDLTAPTVVPTGEPRAADALIQGLSADASTQDIFDRARELVAWRSSTPLDELQLRLVDDATIAQEVKRETRLLVNAQIRNTAYADQFVERITQAQSGTYLALYSSHLDAVLVSETLLAQFLGSIQNKALAQRALLALFLHEAVHAADDRRHNINQVRTLDFRAAFAQSAIFEGHAQWHTRQLCEIAACLDGLQALDRFMFGNTGPNQRAQSGNALSRNVIEYAYVEGERFIDAVARRDNGEHELERLLANPPVDPVQILDPTSWPNHRREQRNTKLIQAMSQHPHPWNGPGFEQIQTSPLKGINLRADPSKRSAAVDGFTRLLTAMASMEIHAVSEPERAPVDLTILEGESEATALLFARTLHANNLARSDGHEASSKVDGRIRLFTSSREHSNGEQAHTLVGVHGRHIVQLIGLDDSLQSLENFARGALQQLAVSVPQAIQ